MKNYKCSLSLTDNRGWNVIHFSSLKGHTHLIKHITSQYPQYISLLHSTDNDGSLALHLACQSGNIQLVTFLISDMKCDVTATDTLYGSNCVMFACFSGNLDLVQLLIQQYKLEPININNTGYSVLHAAAQNGHTHMLKWYSQEYSVDITNHTNNNKYTLAHLAANEGKLHCLQELINKYQCDVNATTTNGSTVLHKACEVGHVPVVLYLTSLPQCNVAAKTSNGSTVLHITCGHSDSLPILKHLVENHQLDLCAVNDEGMAPIHLACSEGRVNLVQYIIEHIPSSLELPDRGQGCTPFLTAVHFNQLEVIKYLISKKCNLSATDDEGSGAVHISVERGHLNVLKYLIDNNYCNPNVITHQGHTPLHVAVLVDRLEIIEYLLKRTIPSVSVAWIRNTKCLLDNPKDLHSDNVHVNAQDIAGNSPLHLACRKGQQSMVKLLSRAIFSARCLLLANMEGQTPLHLAVARGHQESIEALLSSVTGSSTHHDLLTATDNEGSTVFHTACSNGHIDVFHFLSSIYPQGVNVMDNRGRGLLHAACEGWDIEIVKELVEKYKLDPNLKDKDGITCLHLLAERKGVGLLQFGMDMRNIEMYQYLKRHVTNPIPKDKSGRSPLHYACRANNIPIARFLVDTIQSCSSDDPDNNGYTSVHAACEAGSMELVYYFLNILKCNANAETSDFKTLIYFAGKSANLELVQFLVERYNLKPRLHDIEVARATSPDSSIVRYLEKVHHDMILDMVKEQRRKFSK
ncbi:PREDICTED: uncharacterized protein LOC109590109 [Amphimedon queenslandica]|nr:PREDICTED: uncharacterized protein LOC109590109 [Amphimedon queenslandica]|eukprot:XP_019861613.1 PREDICTED: uncharacterized protein LOC109590109 [Amphimedon queenslandica]